MQFAAPLDDPVQADQTEADAQPDERRLVHQGFGQARESQPLRSPASPTPQDRRRRCTAPRRRRTPFPPRCDSGTVSGRRRIRPRASPSSQSRRRTSTHLRGTLRRRPAAGLASDPIKTHVALGNVGNRAVPLVPGNMKGACQHTVAAADTFVAIIDHRPFAASSSTRPPGRPTRNSARGSACSSSGQIARRRLSSTVDRRRRESVSRHCPIPLGLPPVASVAFDAGGDAFLAGRALRDINQECRTSNSSLLAVESFRHLFAGSRPQLPVEAGDAVEEEQHDMRQFGEGNQHKQQFGAQACEPASSHSTEADCTAGCIAR